ncbi:hypothetical protein OF001_U410007 [Pseudomonas sp. OF001]|nr:hypothetical protein OF001_U410007 [Pseudomonas sp. OF001]
MFGGLVGRPAALPMEPKSLHAPTRVTPKMI